MIARRCSPVGPFQARSILPSPLKPPLATTSQPVPPSRSFFEAVEVKPSCSVSQYVPLPVRHSRSVLPSPSKSPVLTMTAPVAGGAMEFAAWEPVAFISHEPDAPDG